MGADARRGILMSKKHFELVARILREQLSADPRADSRELAYANMGARAVLIATAEAFADAFAKENPRFDRDRFLTACGIDNE